MITKESLKGRGFEIRTYRTREPKPVPESQKKARNPQATVASEIGFRPNTRFKKLARLLGPWPLPIALPNSVKRIQGSESQVPAGFYCNLLLCGIKSLVLSRRLRSIITPVKPQLQPTFCHHHKGVARAGRHPPC
jgi:hypothetical protein